MSNFPQSAMVEAFERMFMVRHCPPLSVLKKGSKFAKKHLKSCKWCRKEFSHYDDYEKTGELLSQIKIEIPEDTPVQPGDIREIHLKMKDFSEDGRYINCPKVLVLSSPDELGLVSVAQLFDELDLKTDQDIQVTKLEIAETWNTYSLYSGHLGRCLDSVPKRFIPMILKRSEDFDCDRIFEPFLRLELTVGSFFSLPSCYYAIDLAESQE